VLARLASRAHDRFAKRFDSGWSVKTEERLMNAAFAANGDNVSGVLLGFFIFKKLD
jgi:hypothetical protein